jgi:hypothetical protein
VSVSRIPKEWVLYSLEDFVLELAWKLLVLGHSGNDCDYDL